MPQSPKQFTCYGCGETHKVHPLMTLEDYRRGGALWCPCAECQVKAEEHERDMEAVR